MNSRQFRGEIEKKIDSLRKENQKAMNKGDKTTYQCNCNQLAGISFVTNLLKKVE